MKARAAGYKVPSRIEVFAQERTSPHRHRQGQQAGAARGPGWGCDMNHTVLAEGVGFTEGPLWTRDGRLLVAAMSRGLVLEVDLGGHGVVASIETGGGPNGLTEGPDGALWVAQNAGAVRPSRSPRPVAPGLQRIDGRTVDDLPVPGALAPNDLTLGPDGRIWFTDPGLPGATTRGRICALDPASGQAAVLLGDLDFPNGLAFGPGAMSSTSRAPRRAG